jgi:hypothetical protein
MQVERVVLEGENLLKHDDLIVDIDDRDRDEIFLAMLFENEN